MVRGRPRKVREVRTPVQEISDESAGEVLETTADLEIKESSAGPRCSECGEPVAPGQTFVCEKHIRRG